MKAKVDIFTFGKGSTLRGKNTHWWCHPNEISEWDKQSNLTDVLAACCHDFSGRNKMYEKVWHKEIQCGTESTVKCQDLSFISIHLRLLLEVNFEVWFWDKWLKDFIYFLHTVWWHRDLESLPSSNPSVRGSAGGSEDWRTESDSAVSDLKLGQSPEGSHWCCLHKKSFVFSLSLLLI